MSCVKNLIIFEEPEHVEEISKLQILDQDLIIPFSVSGKLLLDKKGIKCYCPHELVELPDFNQIGIANVGRVRNICNFLDEKLREKFIFLHENKINLLSAGSFKLKTFFDTLYTSYAVLEKLFRELNPERIVVFKKANSTGWVINNRDSIISSLAEKVFSKNYSNIKIISNRLSKPHKLSLPGLKNYATHMRNILALLFNKIHPRNCGDNGLVLHNTHDIPYVINGVLNNVNFYKPVFNNKLIGFRSVRSFRVMGKMIPKKSKVSIDGVREVFIESVNAENYRNMFSGDNELFYFANGCLEDYFLEVAGPILHYAGYIKNMMVNLAPKMLLTSSCRVDLNDAFSIELARALEIPVVTYQEGGGAGYLNWPLFNLDTDLSDYFLVYGNGVKESRFIGGGAEILPVGSVRLANIKRNTKIKTPPQITIYTVLDKCKMVPWQHYPSNGSFFSQAYSHQLGILDTLKNFKGVKFVVKTIKGREFLYRPFIDKRTMRIVTKPLANVLGNASAFILDVPSTVLQECLLTDKPIALLYSRNSVDFESRALELLQKRIRVSSDSAQFYGVIEKLIEDIELGTTMTDEKEFLEDYCVKEGAPKNLEFFFSPLFKNSNGKMELMKTNKEKNDRY